MRRVVAVTVTYQPGPDLAAQVAALAAQVARLVIVDNGSDRPATEFLRSLASDGIEVRFLERNAGIGAGHNAGIAVARAYNATHVLLMDQDSIPHEDMVMRLLEAERSLLERGVSVGALGPVFHDARLRKSWPFYRLTQFGMEGRECAGEAGFVECDFLISSGTLIRSSVLDQVGLMNEGYFLEHVDTEWSLRCRDREYRLFGICAARMEHALGDAAACVPFTGTAVQVYKPYRHYYLFRNALLLWRQPYVRLPWKLNEAMRLLKRLVYFSVMLAPRAERLRYMLLGLWHGLIGRSGPLSS